MATEMQKCEACGGEFVNLGVHKRFCKKIVKRDVPIPAKQGGEETSSASPSVHRFISSRSPELAVIVKHGKRNVLNSERGVIEYVDEAKIAQFRNGMFETDDPEIIAFLTRKYNDPRFPIVHATAVSKA